MARHDRQREQGRRSTMTRSELTVSLVAAAIFAASPANAQTIISDPATTPVVDRTFNYLDLMRLAVPGLVRVGDGYRVGKALELRHISGDKEQAVEIAIGTSIRSPMATLAQSDRGQRVTIMLDLDQMGGAEGIALLALFDIDQEPKLLDAANVAYDRLTDFVEPAKLTMRDGDTPLLISSGHWNSNQSYKTYAMVDLHGDRLRLIDSFFLLSDHDCGYERQQRPVFTATGSPRKPAIQVMVTETVTRRKESCQGRSLPKPGKRKISVTYTWQGKDQRFVKSSDAFERLAKELDERL